ncbi:unnamed protein product [Taenia asiatica]|uniref:Dynein light chain n=1 Tax=Taenia asiatica TaxID=60517 RepID=A0A0R3W6Q5_TAEAS|nr:unnamed protein product [Taenia asiatica]
MSNRYELRNVESDMVENRRTDLENMIKDILYDEKGARKWPQILARRIKERCDDEFKGTWNCHVGPSFGSSFPYESNSYFYGELDDLSILVYKFQ